MLVYDQSLLFLHSFCPTLKDMGKGPVLQLGGKNNLWLVTWGLGELTFTWFLQC